MLPDHLKTEKLELKPFDPVDGDAVFEYWQSDPGWERFNESVPQGFTLADAQDFVAQMIARSRRDQPNWAIIVDGVVMGVVSLSFSQDHQTAVIGYGIHASLRGKGLAVLAANTVITAAFESIPTLRRFRAHTDPANSASIRVLAKLGFTPEDTPEQHQCTAVSQREGATFELWRHRLGVEYSPSSALRKSSDHQRHD